jgi:hypothetical protein
MKGVSSPVFSTQRGHDRSDEKLTGLRMAYLMVA